MLLMPGSVGELHGPPHQLPQAPRSSDTQSSDEGHEQHADQPDPSSDAGEIAPRFYWGQSKAFYQEAICVLDTSWILDDTDRFSGCLADPDRPAMPAQFYTPDVFVPSAAEDFFRRHTHSRKEMLCRTPGFDGSKEVRRSASRLFSTAEVNTTEEEEELADPGRDLFSAGLSCLALVNACMDPSILSTRLLHGQGVQPRM
jgi:hypothetical protein